MKPRLRVQFSVSQRPQEKPPSRPWLSGHFRGTTFGEREQSRGLGVLSSPRSHHPSLSLSVPISNVAELPEPRPSAIPTSPETAPSPLLTPVFLPGAEPGQPPYPTSKGTRKRTRSAECSARWDGVALADHSSSAWLFLFQFLTLRCELQTRKSTTFKCAAQWVSVHLPLGGAGIPSVYPMLFSSL